MNARISVQGPGEPEETVRVAFLSAGFRPFFLFAGLYGVFPLAAWLWAYLGDGATPGDFAPSHWHGHEMIYGFVVAAVAGFLLTAVPNWTRSGAFAGMPLAVLAAVWLGGRLAMWFGDALGPAAVAALDLTMIPLLGVYVGRRLVAHRVRRNYIVLGVLAVLFLGNLMMHLEAMDLTADSATMGLEIGLYGVVFLLAMISGRVIPGFTANALRHRGVEVEAGTPSGVTRAVVVLVIAASLLDVFAADAGPGRFAAGLAALLAALALMVRMRDWHSVKTLGDPIVWVLHAGHFWLVVGFALLALADFTSGIERGAGVHALSAGAFGTTVMAMITRAALGHSGRTIKASPAIAAAYAMVVIGALLRVVAALAVHDLPPGGYEGLLIASGLSWSGGFAVYCLVFWPILTRPRV